MQRFKDLTTAIDMTEGRPWEKLLLFTVPLLVGNVFQQLYSTADAIFLGRFVGDNALAAVGAVIPFFFLIMMLLMGVAVGSGIMVAQYFGAKSREDLSYTIGTSITIITIVSLFMMIFGPLITRPVLVLLRTPYEILEYAILYTNIMLWGILGVAYFNILSGILRGLGDSFSPLLYLIFTSLLNIVLNLFFIVIMGLGVFGAAVGTVVAQFISSILCFRRLAQMQDVFDMGWHYLWPKKQYVIQLLKIGVPTGASQAIFSIAMLITQPLVNYFGATFIAANVIVMRIDGFVMMPAFSFGNAISVYAGQNIGAGKLDRVSLGVKQSLYMAIGTAVVIVAILLGLGHHIAALFTQTQEVIDLGMRILRILVPGYIAMAIAMIMWGVIRGAGDAISPLWGSVINSILIRVPAAFIFVYFMNRPEAVIYSLLLAWICNTIISIIIYRIGKWRKMGIVKHESI